MGEALTAKRRGRMAAGHADVGRPSQPRRNDMLPLLKIEPCAVDTLKSYARKLRKSDLAHVHEIANSISALGFNLPLLIGKDNIVIDGDARLEAAKLLGLSSVPCIRVDHLDESEQRLLRMAVNRLGEKGSWDVGELKAEFEELIIADAPIEITGFGLDEIDQIVIGGDEDHSDKDQSRAAALALPEAPAVARVGDLFLLGPHRVICGDGTDPDLVKRLMRTDVARMVLTDAPCSGAAEEPVTAADYRDREHFEAGAEMADAGLQAFHQSWMTAVVPYLVDGGLLGSLIDWRGLPTFHAAAAALGMTPLDLVVWAQTTAGTGQLYPSQHKLLPLFKKGGAAHVNNIALGKRGRRRSNLWTYPAANAFQDSRPHSVLEDALTDLTNPGEIVLDPFLGAGSTLIAAEGTGRVCCGLERDPLYVDVMIRRYQVSTGKAAVLADTGETFEQVATRRRDEGRPRAMA